MNASRLLPLLLGLVIGSSPASAAPAPGATGAVTARIYDYVGIGQDQIDAAQQQVADTYRQIGVPMRWAQTARAADISAGRSEWPSDSGTMLTIALIASGMGQRIQLPSNVVGYAATDPGGGGRMAFIVVDRTTHIAARGRLFHFHVLGAVVAHEIAHLLLPRRAHARSGLMRPSWNVSDFARPGHQTFSRADAASIRASVDALVHGSRTRVAD
jgi:hypothetical protein